MYFYVYIFNIYVYVKIHKYIYVHYIFYIFLYILDMNPLLVLHCIFSLMRPLLLMVTAHEQKITSV